MEEFYKRVAEILEVEEVKGSDVLESFPEWDSLSMLSVIAMVGSNYGVNLTARDVRSVATAEGLHDLVAAKSGK